jgi:hypothetical protein
LPFSLPKRAVVEESAVPRPSGTAVYERVVCEAAGEASLDARDIEVPVPFGTDGDERHFARGFAQELLDGLVGESREMGEQLAVLP